MKGEIEFQVTQVEVDRDMEGRPFIWLAFEGELNGETVRAKMGLRVAPILTIEDAVVTFPPKESE